jgi:hypothetical protein
MGSIADFIPILQLGGDTKVGVIDYVINQWGCHIWSYCYSFEKKVRKKIYSLINSKLIMITV